MEKPGSVSSPYVFSEISGRIWRQLRESLPPLSYIWGTLIRRRIPQTLRCGVHFKRRGGPSRKRHVKRRREKGRGNVEKMLRKIGHRRRITKGRIPRRAFNTRRRPRPSSSSILTKSTYHTFPRRLTRGQGQYVMRLLKATKKNDRCSDIHPGSSRAKGGLAPINWINFALRGQKGSEGIAKKMPTTFFVFFTSDLPSSQTYRFLTYR